MTRNITGAPVIGMDTALYAVAMSPRARFSWPPAELASLAALGLIERHGEFFGPATAAGYTAAQAALQRHRRCRRRQGQAEALEAASGQHRRSAVRWRT